ncbi:FimV family protein [Methylococcus sp. EFPC2]|uniref:type IV pilus assembly protein FimV n=1 Tax=Methylococcus sp. EFPC2 TaxID=2812648 RepID=UPI0019676C27|nr:hypothetical protein [Methylococcus sp. EFPC2]QSA96270.1 hypothetical protein JWZ97_13695 [Methylococcus sp. EFPC2]
MGQAIYGQLGDAAALTPTLNEAPCSELAFLIGESQRWLPYLPDLPARFGDALAQAVSAAPGDLARHTRRIHHAYRSLDSEALYGALLDLFAVLGHHGRELRRRMLSASRDRLAAEQEQALRLWLESGRRPPMSPRSRSACLSEGVEGETGLLHVREGEQVEIRDPLQEAREFIEYSQLEQAMDLLENAVRRQPERDDLRVELLSLYRATRDHARRDDFRRRLGTELGGLPPCWASDGTGERGSE